MSAQDTALLDAMIARGLASNPQAAATPPLPGTGLPNPDPNSSPPLYGEPPGEGYLYAHDPAFRQKSLVSTDPDTVRTMLLRSIEVCAQNALLPFNEEGAAKLGEAVLRMAQAYLLLDPTVDAQGVPVAGRNIAEAAGQIAAQAAQPPADGQAHGTVKPGKTTGGHTGPPRVQPGQAGQMLDAMHQKAETVLKGSQGSRPLPRPRVGS